MRERDFDILERMVFYCDAIQKDILRFGRSFEDFKADFSYQRSCSMSILQMGELAKKLSDEVRNDNRHIPWKIIMGNRDVFAHDYDDFDILRTWNTLEKNIPELQQSLESILQQYEETTELEQ